MTLFQHNMPAPGVPYKEGYSQVEINVMDKGAIGDYETDDTAAIQAAIDTVARAGGGTVFFPKPKVAYKVRSLDLIPGISYIGNGAMLKRVDSGGKWMRTLTTERVQYQGDTDSAPIIISGLILDGNRTGQGSYTGFQLEQAHLIFVDADPAYPGKVRVIIENCVLQECVADGISLYKNCDAKVSNVYAWNCWRGGIVSTGGYARVQIDNVSIDGDVHPSGIDIETDGAGYGGSLRSEFMVNNLFVRGDFDVGIKDDSIFTGNNIIVNKSPFNLSAPDSTIRITNSKFHVGVASSTNNRVTFPKDVLFENCIFVADGIANEGSLDNFVYYAINLYWNVSGTTHTDQKLQFISCKFLAENVKAGDTVRGISFQADRRGDNNVLLLENCTFESSLDTGIYMVQGGTIAVRNTLFNCDEPMSLAFAGTYYFNVELLNNTYGSAATKYMSLRDGIAASTLKQSVILEESQNVINGIVGTWVNNTYIGGRIIYGAAAPTAATPGMRGDMYRLKVPVAGSAYEWVCVTSSTTAAVWKPSRTLGA